MSALTNNPTLAAFIEFCFSYYVAIIKARLLTFKPAKYRLENFMFEGCHIALNAETRELLLARLRNEFDVVTSLVTLDEAGEELEEGNEYTLYRFTAKRQFAAVTAENAREYQTGRFHAEASELGWAPGEVPRELQTTLGNKQPFVLHRNTADRFEYRQSAGCLDLTVYND